MKLPLDESLQEGKDIDSVVSLSQAFNFFTFFVLSSSPSFPYPMAYEQFVPPLLFISFERNFRLRLISVWTDKILREVPYTPPTCPPTGGKHQIPNSWVLMSAEVFLHQRHSIMCGTAVGARSGTQVSSVKHCNISLLFTCSLSGPVSPGSLLIHWARTDGLRSFCMTGGAQYYPSPLLDEYVLLQNKAWSCLN